MKQTGFTRTLFTRYRQGEATGLALTPAWLYVRHVKPEADLHGTWSAKIRVGIDRDVRLGDVLAQEDWRLFVVQQIAPEQATKMLLCSELRGVIPDDFSSQQMNAFWMKAGVGWWANVLGEACVKLTPPVASKPSQGALLYQCCRGDFDVAAKILCPFGEATNGQFAYLGAQMESGGVWIGGCGLGAPGVVRLDETAGSLQMTTLETSAQYFRIVRRGNDLLTFYGPGTKKPTSEADWKLLRPQVECVTCASDAYVGVGGMALDAGLVSTVYGVWNEWHS